MPYITPRTRQALRRRKPLTPGELNYEITTTILDYLDRWGVDYGRFNEVIGVLECAKQELYRRMVAGYEDKKREENGDVYPG